MSELGKELHRIKTFAKFGLISISPHARQRISERGISTNKIYEALTQRSSEICQFKDINEYHGNKNPRYVICGNVSKLPYHIVIEKYPNEQYSIVTVYHPSQQYFYDKGRFVRRKRSRHTSKKVLSA